MTDKVHVEYVPLEEVRRWPRNPKLHNEEFIEKSMDRFGFTSPLLVDDKSGKLVAGHGRLDTLCKMKDLGASPPDRIIVSEDGSWQVPVIRGLRFKDEKEAEAYLLTDNQLVIEGGWDQPVLDEILKEIDAVGFQIQREMDQSPPDEVGEPDSYDGVDLDDIPAELEGVWDLKEDIIFPSSNSLGIPDLLPDKLVQELPSPLDTWGDRQTTPDDGNTWWLYNHGVGSSSGIPWSRTVVSYFSWDKDIETIWNTPSFYVGKYLRAGVKYAIVPDFSIWDTAPRVLQEYSVYRAQWIGRWFQEAGLQVIPRLEYFVEGAKDFSLLGIPPNPPVVATQLHTRYKEEHIPGLRANISEAVGILKPNQLLVYCSKIGKRVLEGLALPCEVIIIPTASEKRKKFKREAEQDPYLKELRKRKKKREHTRTTSPEGRT